MFELCLHFQVDVVLYSKHAFKVGLQWTNGKNSNVVQLQLYLRKVSMVSCGRPKGSK